MEHLHNLTMSFWWSSDSEHNTGDCSADGGEGRRVQVGGALRCAEVCAPVIALRGGEVHTLCRGAELHEQTNLLLDRKSVV